MKSIFYKSTLIVLMFLLFSGCSLFQGTSYEAIEMPDHVYVPVYEPCPTLEVIERDYLPIYSIEPDSSNEEVVKAYYQTILILKFDNRRYKEMVESCLEKKGEDDN